MDTLDEYTDERADHRTGIVRHPRVRGTLADASGRRQVGSALEPVRRYSAFEQIGIDRVVDA